MLATVLFTGIVGATEKAGPSVTLRGRSCSTGITSHPRRGRLVPRPRDRHSCGRCAGDLRRGAFVAPTTRTSAVRPSAQTGLTGPDRLVLSPLPLCGQVRQRRPRVRFGSRRVAVMLKGTDFGISLETRHLLSDDRDRDRAVLAIT